MLGYPDVETRDFEEVALEQEAIQAELRRRRWLRDPVAWAEERLGDTLWSGQKRILRALRDHRRVAVQSCHEIGKSYVSAIAVGWWLDTRPVGDSFVVTSAPTAKQVEAILWREIGRVHARGGLNGRVTSTAWKMEPELGKEELVAFGRKPDDYDTTGFQGIHALEVLVLFDEADGMPEPLWEGADSLTANDMSKQMVIGNPDSPDSHFAEICKPGSGWHVISISAFDSPNFTGEQMPDRVKKQLIGPVYVEEKRKKWAPLWTWTADNRVEPPLGADPTATHPYWQSKILGRTPLIKEGDNVLIPHQWIRAAQLRTLTPEGANELGVDVGGGGDSSTICHRRGPIFRIVHEDRNPDTMHTCGIVLATRRSTEAKAVKVDTIGIGHGVVDRATEVAKEDATLRATFYSIEGVNVGEAAEDSETFANRRAELWWAVRERFEAGEIDIDENDEDLAGELVSLRFKRTSSGKIQIESKDEAKRRGVQSPNRADALMLANAPSKRNKRRAGTW